MIGSPLSRQTGTFVYEQVQPSTEWVITHNLHKSPSVTIVDSAGTVVMGAIQYISKDQIVVTFTAGFAGSAYLN